MAKILSYDELCKAHNLPYDGDGAIDALSKALTTGNSGPITVPRTSPLMLENMDGLMTEVLLTEEHFKIFSAIPRVPSAGPYFEWNRHKGFGSRRGNIGFAEGGAPKGGISQFERNGIYNRYLGVKGGVTHQMQIAGMNGGTVEDPVTRENRDRSLELFERLEREVVFGDSTITDNSGNVINFDGLLTQMEAKLPAHVIDMQGAPLSFDQFDDAAEKLVTTGKQPTVNGYTSYMSTHVTKGLNKQYKDANVVRQLKEGQSADFTPGFKLPGYETAFGTFKFDNSIMLEECELSAPLSTTIADVPGTPVAATSTGATGAANPLKAGTYYYKVAAFNDTGESLPSVASAGIVADAGQKIPLVITKPSGTTVGYRIYRSLTATGTYKWIGKVADSGASTTNFEDDGSWCTSDTNGNEQNGLAIIIKPDNTRDVAMSQMAPLMKMPLPQVDTTFPFLLLLYCALVVKAPERVLIYKNCGKYVAP